MPDDNTMKTVPAALFQSCNRGCADTPEIPWFIFFSVGKALLSLQQLPDPVQCRVSGVKGLKALCLDIFGQE